MVGNFSQEMILIKGAQKSYKRSKSVQLMKRIILHKMVEKNCLMKDCRGELFDYKQPGKRILGFVGAYAQNKNQLRFFSTENQ